jgi:hypothetical protein
MTVWLDLIATPNTQLGVLEEFGNTITPNIARDVVKTIAKKYDPRVLFPGNVADKRMSLQSWFIQTSSSQVRHHNSLLSTRNPSENQKIVNTLFSVNYPLLWVEMDRSWQSTRQRI